MEYLLSLLTATTLEHKIHFALSPHEPDLPMSPSPNSSERQNSAWKPRKKYGKQTG
ncbi:MAG: hypothetical protein R2788_04230 [Saprospiraceae bacterium]